MKKKGFIKLTPGRHMFWLPVSYWGDIHKTSYDHSQGRGAGTKEG
jgi:hypothetical protein